MRDKINIKTTPVYAAGVVSGILTIRNNDE